MESQHKVQIRFSRMHFLREEFDHHFTVTCRLYTSCTPQQPGSLHILEIHCIWNMKKKTVMHGQKHCQTIITRLF